MTPGDERDVELRRRQKSRSVATGLLLGGAVILIFLVSIVKMVIQ